MEKFAKPELFKETEIINQVKYQTFDPKTIFSLPETNLVNPMSIPFTFKTPNEFLKEVKVAFNQLFGI